MRSVFILIYNMMVPYSRISMGEKTVHAGIPGNSSHLVNRIDKMASFSSFSVIQVFYDKLAFAEEKYTELLI